jgi:transposase InsO family protein
MAKDGVAVDSRLAAAVAARARGESVRVTVVAAELGVSRKTFYKYLARFRAEGVPGFFPRSRAPVRHPNRVSAAVEDAIVTARKELPGEGEYCGAITIRWRLEAQGWGELVPSRATIHRVLQRHGMVVPQPRKAPKAASRRRFQAAHPNDMWQMDGFGTRLADGTEVTVIQLEDDCSRMDVYDLAAVSENGEAAWAAFQAAAAGHGLPKLLLTDNAKAFNGHRHGFTSALERRVRALGVTPISSSVNHPGTCGKDERQHSTVQQWLAARPPAEDLPELQALLDIYRGWYNTQRRHQSLGGLTPQQRWDLADQTGPNGPLPEPPVITTPIVSPRGAIGVDGVEIGLAKRYAGERTVVFRTGDHVTVFIGADNVRTLTIDRSRDYQPSGINPRTGRPRAAAKSAPLTKASGQGGAPAAQRGRTTLTAGRDGAQ